MNVLLLPAPPAIHAHMLVEAAAPEKEVVEVREQKRQTLADIASLLNNTYTDVHFTMRGSMLHGASWCGRVEVEITQKSDEIHFVIYGTEAGATGMIRDTEDVYAFIRESLQDCCQKRR
jgi:hypothetical protein